MILLAIVIFFCLVYAVLVICFGINWLSIPEFIAGKQNRDLRFSVVIPARNEERNLPLLLKALQEQDYPHDHFEIIVVDDHSSDDTLNIAASFNGVKAVSLQGDNINSYKKKAIETGIGVARYEWIVGTDADCRPGKEWLKTLAGFIEEKKAVFVAAPVQYHPSKSFLGIFQEMDLMVLQGITGAVVSRNWLSMANGANMAYTKAAFYEVEGFRGVDQLASGDDMLLMQKIREKYPESTGFLKSRKAIVRTSPAGSWNEFFHQRIRWASKARYYKDKKMLPVLLLVYLFNCCFLFLIAAAFAYRGYWNYVWIFWAAKTLVELPLFVSASLFFRRLRLLPFFILFQPFHIFYTIISGLFGQFGKYEWKGRRVE